MADGPWTDHENSSGTHIQSHHYEFVATVGCPGCEAIKDNTRSQAHSDRCKVRVEDCFRRKEAINEALAEELQRDEQRKQRGSRVTTAALAPAPKSVASTSHVLS